MLPEIYNDLSKSPWFLGFLRSCKNVYHAIGHGLLESKYQRALAIALAEEKIEYQKECLVTFHYCTDIENKDGDIGEGRMDFLLCNEAVVELKTIHSEIRPDDIRQLHNYLIHGNYKVGFCVNFPKTYQKNLTIVVIIHSDCKYLSSEKSVLTLDEQWYIFNLRMNVEPNNKHVLKTLGMKSI